MNHQTKIIIASGLFVIAVQIISFSLLLKKGITIHAHFHVEDASFIKDVGLFENSSDRFYREYALLIAKEDESNNYYFGRRYYNPAIGRFFKPEQMPDMAQFDSGENPLKNIDVNGFKTEKL